MLSMSMRGFCRLRFGPWSVVGVQVSGSVLFGFPLTNASTTRRSDQTRLVSPRLSLGPAEPCQRNFWESFTTTPPPHSLPPLLRPQSTMESSRIFVRGLPPKFSDDEVRKHFSKFPVTDVRFFPARRFAFVGYKTEEDAKKAVSYFNKSFIRLCKIFVEIARPVSPSAALAWPRS